MTRTLPLDYPGADLHILATTPIEESFRANACAKEPWTVAWLEAMPAGSVLYDVGANVGSYSLIAAALGHTVVAIEPAFANYARLCENILLNHLEHKIIPLCIGLAEQSHTEVMLQHLEPGYSGGGSRLQVPVLSARVLALHLSLPEATHVKIDVDGAEVRAVAGFGDSGFGDRSVQSFLIEVSDPPRLMGTWSVGSLLAKWGYDLVARHDTRDGEPIHGMFMGEWQRK